MGVEGMENLTAGSRLPMKDQDIGILEQFSNLRGCPRTEHVDRFLNQGKRDEKNVIPTEHLC